MAGCSYSRALWQAQLAFRFSMIFPALSCFSILRALWQAWLAFRFSLIFPALSRLAFHFHFSLFLNFFHCNFFSSNLEQAQLTFHFSLIFLFLYSIFSKVMSPESDLLPCICLYIPFSVNMNLTYYEISQKVKE